MTAYRSRNIPAAADASAESQMRIAFVSNTADFLYSHRRELIEACDSRGWTVRLFAPQPKTSAPDWARRFTLEPIRLDRYGTNPLRDAASAIELSSKLTSWRADVIHNFTAKAILAGTLASTTLPHALVVNSVTGVGVGGAGTLRGLAVRTALLLAANVRPAAFICQNAHDAKTVSSFIRTRGSDVTTVRGSGVDLKRFYPSERPLDGREVSWLYASRLLASKGLRVLARAAEIVRRAGVPFRVTIAGPFQPGHPDAVAPTELEQWEQAGLATYVGDAQEVAHLLRSHDCAVLPSLGGEGVPKFLLEAVASATPFVTTQTPGCDALCADSKAGIAVAPNDAQCLARAIIDLSTSAPLRAELRKHAYRFRPHVDVEEIVARHLAIYEQHPRVSVTPSG